MLRPATKMSAIDFLSCLLSKASGITQGPRSAQRDVARSEAAEKCASLQRKNMTIPTGRRNHDQYRRFSRHHPGLFAICSLDASLVRRSRPDRALSSEAE